MSTNNRPVRVLHIIDTLAGGGTERIVWDTVRLSDPQRVIYRVVTFFPDGYLGPFVYADRLRQAGAYGSRQKSEQRNDSFRTHPNTPAAPVTHRPLQRQTDPLRRMSQAIWKVVSRLLGKLPLSWKLRLGTA